MSNSTLVIHIIIYPDASIRVDETHVAIVVEDASNGKFYLFHATEDTMTEEEMKYGM